MNAVLSDEILVTACGAGDREALGELFGRYEHDVYKFLASVSDCSPHDLDDLVQTTFVEVFRSVHRFVGRSSVKTWIFGIAANVARMHLRGEIRKRRALRAVSDIPPAYAPTPGEQAEGRESIERLRAALCELPYPLRSVFVMCALEGIPGVEAARALDLPEGTLWRRLHEARRHLIRYM